MTQRVLAVFSHSSCGSIQKISKNVRDEITLYLRRQLGDQMTGYYLIEVKCHSFE